MEDLVFQIYFTKKGDKFLYIRLQTERPFMVKRWCFVNRGKFGWNLHLFPLHIQYEKHFK